MNRTTRPTRIEDPAEFGNAPTYVPESNLPTNPGLDIRLAGMVVRIRARARAAGLGHLLQNALVLA